MEPPFPNPHGVSQERRESQLGVPQPYLAQEHNAEPGDGSRLGMDLFVLEQITSALRLPINSIVTVEEQPGQFRARIAMAVPPSTSTAAPETKEFSGDLAPTKYGAVESAAASAIDFMKVEKGVRIDDSSQDLISKITEMANMYRAAREARKLAFLSRRYDGLIEEISRICVEFAGLLPIRREVGRAPDGQAIVYPVYGGATPPRTQEEKVAFALCKLARDREGGIDLQLLVDLFEQE